MNWNEQAEAMAKAWAETQKKAWDNWYDFAQSASTNSPFAQAMPGSMHDIADQGFEAWLGEADPTAKGAAERLFTAQKAMMNFVQFSTKIWQDIAEKVDSGQDWQAVMDNYLTQMRQTLAQSPLGVFSNAQKSEQLWQLYLEQMQQFTQPWLQAWQQSPGLLANLAAGQKGSSVGELSGLFQQAYQDTFGQLLDSPTLGLTRELEEKIRKGFKAWLNYNQASFEYQGVVMDAWVKTFESFRKELTSLSQKGAKIDNLAAVASLWNNTAEAAFLEVFRSEKYIRAQGKLVGAIMTQRIQQREIVELLSKINDIPTRTEVDAAHKANYQLKKDVKALKKAIAAGPKADPAMAKALSEAQATIATLQAEVNALKKAVADLAPPKAASTAATRRKTTAKAKTTKSKTEEEQA